MARNSERFWASSDSRRDSSAGSRVSPATRMTPIAMANGTAEVGVERRSVASSRVSIAAITVAAEKVMDSPTLVTERTIASRAGGLGWMKSPSRLPPRPRAPG